jgi:hypothetical protein
MIFGISRTILLNNSAMVLDSQQYFSTNNPDAVWSDDSLLYYIYRCILWSCRYFNCLIRQRNTVHMKPNQLNRQIRTVRFGGSRAAEKAEERGRKTEVKPGILLPHHSEHSLRITYRGDNNPPPYPTQLQDVVACSLTSFKPLPLQALQLTYTVEQSTYQHYFLPPLLHS